VDIIPGAEGGLLHQPTGGDMQSAADGISHPITIGFLCFVARLSPSLDGMTPDTIFSLFFKYF
jgi:hypothetical protein